LAANPWKASNETVYRQEKGALKVEATQESRDIASKLPEIEGNEPGDKRCERRKRSIIKRKPIEAEDDGVVSKSK